MNYQLNNFNIVLIEETKDWNESVRSKTGKIYSAYMYDPERLTHIDNQTGEEKSGYALYYLYTSSTKSCDDIALLAELNERQLQGEVVQIVSDDEVDSLSYIYRYMGDTVQSPAQQSYADDVDAQIEAYRKERPFTLPIMPSEQTNVVHDGDQEIANAPQKNNPKRLLLHGQPTICDNKESIRQLKINVAEFDAIWMETDGPRTHFSSKLNVFVNRASALSTRDNIFATLNHVDDVSHLDGLLDAMSLVHGENVRLMTENFYDENSKCASDFNGVEVHAMYNAIGTDNRSTWVQEYDAEEGSNVAGYSVMLHLKTGGTDTFCDIPISIENTVYGEKGFSESIAGVGADKAKLMANRIASSLGELIMTLNPTLSRREVLGVEVDSKALRDVDMSP